MKFLIVGVVVFHGRYKANVDGHEFSFDRGDIHNLDFKLFSDGVVSPDMCYDCCYIGFLDSSISDDSGIVGGDLRLTKGLVDALDVFVKVFITR